MRTITCIMLFEDGQVVTGTINASSSQAEYPISYTGPLDRLPRHYETGDESDLKTLFSVLARQLHAECRVDATGLYDTWAL